MIWLTHSDRFLTAALWIGLAAVGMIILLVLQILFLRARLRRRAARFRRVVDCWRPLMTAASANLPPGPLPLLAPEDEVDFLKLWLHFQVSLRGQARENLNELARAIGCGAIALRLLEKGGRGEQLFSILMLGHLREPDAVPLLRAMVHRGDRLLALHALGALVQVDAQVAAHELAPELILGRDWQPREVVSVLVQAREACTPVLCALVPGTNEQHLPRLLQVMEGLRVTPPTRELTTMLEHGAPEVRIAALRCVADPALRPHALALLAHDDWRVRMQAAKALGRVGRPGDELALAALLSDAEWWVRYRTAQVLSELPFLSPARLAQIVEQNTDRFAADMLRQVRAERAFA